MLSIEPERSRTCHHLKEADLRSTRGITYSERLDTVRLFSVSKRFGCSVNFKLAASQLQKWNTHQLTLASCVQIEANKIPA